MVSIVYPGQRATGKYTLWLSKDCIALQKSTVIHAVAWLLTSRHVGTFSVTANMHMVDAMHMMNAVCAEVMARHAKAIHSEQSTQKITPEAMTMITMITMISAATAAAGMMGTIL